MIIHINKVRFEKIRTLGIPLAMTATGMDVAVKGINNYHLLDGELAICDECGIEQRSIEVETPAELEHWKLSHAN